MASRTQSKPSVTPLLSLFSLLFWLGQGVTRVGMCVFDLSRVVYLWGFGMSRYM